VYLAFQAPSSQISDVFLRSRLKCDASIGSS
jgi:hypothetical protein